MSADNSVPIRTRIWREEAEPDNAFAAATCRCHGYDVHGDLLGRLGWAEYLFLLFRGDAPTAAQAALLNGLAVALANPGPRDPAVHAAMAGGVGGSSAASCLMAALAVGAGGSGGAREVWRAMRNLTDWGLDLAAWQAGLAEPATGPADVWPAVEHPPGFDRHGVRCATPVRKTLDLLSGYGAGPALAWLRDQRTVLEAAAGGMPLAMPGIAAAAFADLGCTPDEGEMLFLLLRMPGAAAHALEQRKYGYKKFPFFRVELLDDPAVMAAPP